MNDEIISNFEIEIKRGFLTLAVLSQLKEKEYGYSLLQKLQNKNVEIEAGTLYPLLRRLEKQGLLESIWDTDGDRPKKFYFLSENGKKLYIELKKRWDFINKQFIEMLEEK